jgi:predicted RNA binding protein YcfA (HicA-like mRNA interferase family)
MTKIPRSLSGSKLCERLSRLDYFADQRSGSHQVMTTLANGEHHVSVPQHKPLIVGTLNGILKDVAQHFNISVTELLRKLDL